MTSNLQWRQWLWLILLSGLFHPTAIWAHGGGAPRLFQVPAGPYQLTLWLSPDPPRVGALQLAVEADVANVAVTDLDMEITMHPLGQPGNTMRKVATIQRTLFISYYNSDVTLSQIGQWDVSIAVAGAAGSGNVRFLMDVLPAQQLPWEFIFWSVLAACALIWVVWGICN